jgi:hypothetical protein
MVCRHFLLAEVVDGDVEVERVAAILKCDADERVAT